MDVILPRAPVGAKTVSSSQSLYSFNCLIQGIVQIKFNSSKKLVNLE